MERPQHEIRKQAASGDTKGFVVLFQYAEPSGESMQSAQVVPTGVSFISSFLIIFLNIMILDEAKKHEKKIELIL